MFWALAAGRIDTGDRRYVHELGDIESLNRRALAGELEVTAVSLHAYAYSPTAMRCWRTARVSATAMDLESWPAHRAPRIHTGPSEQRASWSRSRAS